MIGYVILKTIEILWIIIAAIFGGIMNAVRILLGT
jgi:hypothetical protein